MSDINFFAETTARGKRQKFGIRLDDRRRHMYVIGKTGMGKTQMLQNMAIQDIQAGRGVGIIDPHGEFAEALLDYVPQHRINDVVYFNPANTDMPIGFNIMESVGAEQRYFIASGLMAAFKKIWVDVWSARMEYILNNALLALLEYPDATIMGANRMLADKEYRRAVVENVKDPAIKSYWINEFAKYPERYREEATSSIQNKIGQFISNPLIRNIVGQTKSTFNLRDIMDEKKILIVNLSKGRIGEDNTALLGTMFITKLQIAAMSRVDILEEERQDFFVYVDEFQTFATPSFAGILSEARKYRLSLILAHQYIAQMDEVVRDAVFGNAGTLVCFRIGAADAEFLETEFKPSFFLDDLVNISKFNIALKLMIDGIASRAFSAITLPPFPPPEEHFREKIIQVSSERYGRPLAEIQEKIARWSGVFDEYAEVKSDKPMYRVQCSSCGKTVDVNFEPDGRRPVYCRDCLAKRMSERDTGWRRESNTAHGSAGGVPRTIQPAISRGVPREMEKAIARGDSAKIASMPLPRGGARVDSAVPLPRSDTDRKVPQTLGAQPQPSAMAEAKPGPAQSISLEEAMRRYPLKQPPSQRTEPKRILPPPIRRPENLQNETPGNANTVSAQVLGVSPRRVRSRAQVNLASLRLTLRDVMPPAIMPGGSDDEGGIMSEGREISF